MGAARCSDPAGVTAGGLIGSHGLAGLRTATDARDLDTVVQVPATSMIGTAPRERREEER